MPQIPPEEAEPTAGKQPKNQLWFESFWPKRPWWGKFYEQSFDNGTAAEGCGLGCLIMLIVAPLLIVVTDKNGEFKIQLVDLFCMTSLIGVLLAYQVNLEEELISVDKFWIPLAIGLIAGIVLAVLRQRVVWIFAGPAAVPVMWLLVAIGKGLVALYQ
ncbi:hypothetical protein [Bremerella sp.]|uniref:hypothetical protein n=1 Tax=Bremerella sp. TaxID=2795602 RepID=UPI00391A47E6